MDKIAADPEIINRSLTDTGAAPVVVQPVSVAAPAPTTAVADGDRMGNKSDAPLVNLLKPVDGPAVVIPPAAATPAEPVRAPGKRQKIVVAGIVAVALLAVGGGAYAWYANNQAKPVAVAPTPTSTPTPTPGATPVPTPTPSPTPSPSPTPTPAPQEVSAPVVAPTTDHPQTVTVKSPSGLWLRSTPNSSNKKNIIGWMPSGAQVSVDQVGDFWWHGSYGGKTGYFAVNYTH